KYLLIGMIGRVNYWKGQEYFIKLAAEISKRHPNVRFIMVGDAFPGYEYLYDHLKHLIEKENLTDKIYNLGYRTDIVNILNSLDVFVLPSVLPDPFPTVILEAMAAAKPVVATLQGGAVEMLEDGESGIFIPINNPIVAASKMSELISNPLERIRIGKNAKRRIENSLSIASFDRAMLQIIEQS
ncbi:MAG: glycosyltransferase family 4 protein, partial [Daejeonella sp.]